MGLLDKLKGEIGKVIQIERRDPNAVYLNAFDEDGSVKSDSLPETKNLQYYSIDVEANEIVIVEKVPGNKYKLLKKVSLEDIAEVRALKKECKEFSSFSMISYEFGVITTSGEGYIFNQSFTKQQEEISSLTIKAEMKAILGLNKLMLTFAPSVTDAGTKLWYNEIYAERGTGPVFDENGNIDLTAFLEMHKTWFATQQEEWASRMNNVRI